MPFDMDQIETLVVVILENRSFDHMLGYRSLPGYSQAAVDGLKADPAWMQSVANAWKGAYYPPFHSADPSLPADPPHERGAIAVQLGQTIGGPYPMKGFVASYASVASVIGPQHPPAVMGYYEPADVPITDFFAQNFAICDRWFAPLPASTQPNRLMAMAGFSMIDGNKSFLGFPDQELVYDWLTKKGVRWRVYHDGMPFFMLMKKWLPEILTSGAAGEHFRPLRQLVIDVQDEDPATFPQVIFVEPKYTDAPPAGHGRDDHPPTSIAGGQAFLWETYLALTSKPERWAKTSMVVTYDEHGGFFDHVPPLEVVTNAPTGAAYTPFVSTGVRVPAMVVSPFVEADAVFSGPLDHTSVLRFLGEKFNAGKYSAAVDGRAGIGSLRDVFTRDVVRVDIPTPPPPAGAEPADTVQVDAFADAAREAYNSNPAGAASAVPETWHV